MKIAIDARFLTHPQLGGFKTYTENLVRALSQVDSENEYVLYLDRPPVDGVLPQTENFTYQVVPATLPGFGMPVREQILLRRQIVIDKPDLVHFLCNTAPTRVPAKFILSLLDVIQVKEPQTFRTTRSMANFKQWAISSYSKWTILKTVQAAERVITLSLYEKDEIAKHLNIASHRICVTHMAPNLVFRPVSCQEKEAWRAELRRELGLRRRFIMGVGYEPRKNISLLVEGFSRIAASHPDVDLVIVAAHEERRKFFERLAIDKDVAGRVHMLPAQQPSDLMILYNLAEVFVFPSERESFGAPPLEAIACGTPAIAMNMTSLPEVLGDGAILVDGKDVQTWANAIEQVLTDDDLREDLIVRGLQQAAKLTWKRCAQDTVRIYQSVCDEISNRGSKGLKEMKQVVKIAN